MPKHSHLQNFLGVRVAALSERLLLADGEKLREIALESRESTISSSPNWEDPSILALGTHVRVFIGVPYDDDELIQAIQDDYNDQADGKATALKPDDALRYCRDFPPTVDTETVQNWITEAKLAVGTYLGETNKIIEQHNEACAQLVKDRLAAISKARALKSELKLNGV